ncbi:hypothetical protein [Candidatus Uabimicrobium sp. HlEnr_7]|uniref:hypothetical protein n=1 Tax=Candidatus Uabimicrobium helgolandensis TaxID=3095367 RepID=UPI003556BA20
MTGQQITEKKIVKYIINLVFFSCYVAAMLVAGEYYLTTLALIGVAFFGFWFVSTFGIKVAPYYHKSCAIISFIIFIILQIWQIYTFQQWQNIFKECREKNIPISETDDSRYRKSIGENGNAFIKEADQILIKTLFDFEEKVLSRDEQLHHWLTYQSREDLIQKVKLSEVKNSLIEEYIEIINTVDHLVQTALKYPVLISKDNHQVGGMLRRYYEFKFYYLLKDKKIKEAINIIKVFVQIIEKDKNYYSLFVAREKDLLILINAAYQASSSPEILQQLLDIVQNYARVREKNINPVYVWKEAIEKTKSIDFFLQKEMIRFKFSDWGRLCDHFIPMGYLLNENIAFAQANLKYTNIFTKPSEVQLHHMLNKFRKKSKGKDIAEYYQICIEHFFEKTAYAKCLWICIFHELHHPQEKIKLENIPDGRKQFTIDPFTRKKLMTNGKIVYSVGKNLFDDKGHHSFYFDEGLDIACVIK